MYQGSRWGLVVTIVESKVVFPFQFISKSADTGVEIHEEGGFVSRSDTWSFNEFVTKGEDLAGLEVKVKVREVMECSVGKTVDIVRYRLS
jgi:hypothetical protein